MSDSTPYTDDGLQDLGNVDFEDIAEANLAYILETELGKSGIDPKNSSRTNATNRLVHRSLPSHRQTIFPVVVVGHENTNSEKLGFKGGHAQHTMDFKIRIEGEGDSNGKKNVQSLATRAKIVLTSDSVMDSLISRDMNYNPESFIVNSTRLARDPTRDNRFFIEFVVRYFTLTIN